MVNAKGLMNRRGCFVEIDEPNILLLNAMEATFVHCSYHFDALKLFQKLRNLSVKVDNTTFSVVLEACVVLTDLDIGRTIHSMAFKSGVNQYRFVESAVIDAYCKCGCIEDAEKAFRDISKCNLAAWNAMLMGYPQHGCFCEVCLRKCLNRG